MSLAQDILSLDATQPTNEARFKALLADTDEFLREIKVPQNSDMHFDVNGVTFHARLISEASATRIVMWAPLGFLPYSVTDATKRHKLIDILEGARYLPTAKIGIDKHMQILVKGTYHVTKPLSPDYFFPPLIKLLQETRAFIALIGENL